MVELTVKQQAFVRRMSEGEEFEREGVNLLLHQGDFIKFFDPIKAAGLFDPSRNPPPKEGDQVGYVRIPYWHILDFLIAVARIAGETRNVELAEKVLAIIREVSNYDVYGPLSGNYHTARVFTEIYGLLPTQAISMQDIDLLPTWLSTKFDNSSVAAELAKGTLRHFVESPNSDDWLKACRLLSHVTALSLNDQEAVARKRIEKSPIVDDYWLRTILENITSPLAAKMGPQVVDVLLDRVGGIFSSDVYQKSSWLLRPAIEPHDQNHSWDNVTNAFVDSLRDALLAWFGANQIEAKDRVDVLLRDGRQIVQRIAIYIVSEHFDFWREELLAVMAIGLRDIGTLHETYKLIEVAFERLNENEKIELLASLRQMPKEGKDPVRWLEERQMRYLSAMQGKGFEAVDIWLRDLKSRNVGIPPHPDFLSFMETRWGPGESQYDVPQLLEFKREGVLVERLNAFTPSDNWTGPNTRALCDALEEAVVTEPSSFLDALPTFLVANRPYQYALLNGIRRLRSDEKNLSIPHWEGVWAQLISFLSKIISEESFWSEPVIEDENLTPNRDWIPSIIAEILRSGVRNDDEKAIPENLLLQSLALIQILLEHLPSEQKADADDAMSAAINLPRGKSIEALVEHALRACRLADKLKGNHAEAWIILRPIFDAEIAKCQNGNFEFSTLAGAYLANLRYLNEDWWNANFNNIFSINYPANCLAALDGLSYAPAAPYIYSALRESGIIDWALACDLIREQAREKLVQRLALAFLWGQAQLADAQFGSLFHNRRFNDLEVMARFFWSVSNQPLEQAQREKIRAFWSACMKWAGGLESPPAELFSALAMLACYIDVIGDEELLLLTSIAPYASYGHNVDYFIEALERLAADYYVQVSKVFGALLETYKPSYDFDDRIKSIVQSLGGHEETKLDAIKYADQLRYLPGMLSVYAKVANANKD